MSPRGQIAILVLLAVPLGCDGAKTGAAIDASTSRAAIVTALYTRAAFALGRPPKDENELKQAAAKMDLAAFKVGNVDELFLSERDGQPLVIVYNPPAGSDVVVYEQIGVDGKRFVGHRIGEVEEVDETRFKELVPKAAK